MSMILYMYGQVGETPHISQANGIAVGWKIIDSDWNFTKKPCFQASKTEMPQTVR